MNECIDILRSVLVEGGSKGVEQQQRCDIMYLPHAYRVSTSEQWQRQRWSRPELSMRA